MLDVRIHTVPHNAHRYETVGDWWKTPMGVTEIRVSQMSDWRFEILVAIHEFVEQVLCEDRGIREEDVTKFDVLYEGNRAAGDTSEPGNDPLAPYHREHLVATAIEKRLAEELGVNWETYEAYIDSLGAING